MNTVDAFNQLAYGLYALVNTGRCTEEQIRPAYEWLESAVKCWEENDWRPDE